MAETYTRAAADMLATTTTPLQGSLWTHRKTGGVYMVMGMCMLEASWRPAVLYRRARTAYDGVALVGPMIARDRAEFMDGRFEPAQDPRADPASSMRFTPPST